MDACWKHPFTGTLQKDSRGMPTLFIILHVFLHCHLHLGQETVHNGLILVLSLTLSPRALIEQPVKVIFYISLLSLEILVKLMCQRGH